MRSSGAGLDHSFLLFFSFSFFHAQPGYDTPNGAQGWIRDVRCFPQAQKLHPKCNLSRPDHRDTERTRMTRKGAFCVVGEGGPPRRILQADSSGEAERPKKRRVRCLLFQAYQTVGSCQSLTACWYVLGCRAWRVRTRLELMGRGYARKVLDLPQNNKSCIPEISPLVTVTRGILRNSVNNYSLVRLERSLSRDGPSKF